MVMAGLFILSLGGSVLLPAGNAEPGLAPTGGEGEGDPGLERQVVLGCSGHTARSRTDTGKSCAQTPWQR